MKKVLLLIVLLLGLFLPLRVSALSCGDPCNNKDSCNQIIDACQSQIANLQKQANTLSNQIAQFNAQINLAQSQIQETQNEIELLSGRIDQVQGSLQDLTEAFSQRAAETYKMARMDEAVYLLLSASNLSDAISKFHYLIQVENSDQTLLTRLQSAKVSYEDSKKKSEDLQKQLEKQKSLLNSQKASKSQLLALTQNDEKKYQQLLAQAQAQLNQLAGFAESVGTTLIPHQDLSDSWGKYYNQRDSNWGAVAINNSSYSIAAAGCLISSYSMVVTHFGGSITPLEVATNPSNFWVNTALFLKPGPPANGHSAEDVDNPYLSGNQSLKDALSSGAAVIAGLSKDGGPYPNHYSDHWVVLRSVDGDSFKINDPLYQGAMNVSLKDHYSGWTIIQAKIYR